MAKNHSLGVKSVKIAWPKNWDHFSRPAETDPYEEDVEIMISSYAMRARTVAVLMHMDFS